MTDLSIPAVTGALIDEARCLLLAPAGLDDAHLSRVLASIHTHDVDFADLYFQYARSESWSLEEGIVKSGSFNIDRGVGIRAVRGDQQAFAYSDDITLAALEEAAHCDARNRRGRDNRRMPRWAASAPRTRCTRRRIRCVSCPTTQKSRCSSGWSSWRACAIRA